MTRALGLFLLISCCEAAVKVPAIIGDHMLLQRDAPVRIFGTAAPGEPVSVAYRGQTARAVASSWGRWEAWLEPMGLGAAGEMTIRASNTILIADVLVGDVWVGSGQSNMQFAVRQTNNAEAEMAGATFPEIRLFAVPRKGSAVPVEDVAGRWVVCSPETVKDFSAVLYYFGRQLHQGLKAPMGLVHTSWGGTPIAAWLSGPALTGNAALLPLSRSWQEQIQMYPLNMTRYEQGLAKGEKPAVPMGPGHPHEPTTLYNGMIAPIAKYTIKGALWYQGESEAGRGLGHVYGEALETLVGDWRRAFGQGNFPFFYVQLANFGNAAKNGHWMRVQEGQVKAAGLKKTGVVIINDIGEATDIHPRNKQEVSRRLALLARHVAYGETGFVYSSPLYRQVTVEEGGMRVWFDHAGTGLKTRDGGAVKGFMIAGRDGKFWPAVGRIEGDAVVVSHPEVKEPRAVRYAWDYNPEANLVNSAGLPASLFRSDERDEVVFK
ncbi:MAG: sialate O-acetylesterase [Acidobacteria bacterium]|nr:sialate O-acetylesterase [Acidobacteriota bacterium]